MDIGVDEIRVWHLDRGFDDVGYHHVIRRSGAIEDGRLHEIIGAHTIGHNADSIGICLVGGMSNEGRRDFNFTFGQIHTLINLVAGLLHRYPQAKVYGHRDFSCKPCPCFDTQELLR
jgi:N-acetyl-anhydromuramyl-L-alanine amidase AmpD